MAAIVFQFVEMVGMDLPMTLDASAWYASYGYLALVTFGAMVLYAFRTSLGGRPLLAAQHLDD